jgi:hypothetical protein
MNKYKKENKKKAIAMYKEGISPKKIFKKLFPEIDLSKYQKDYPSKTISF